MAVSAEFAGYIRTAFNARFIENLEVSPIWAPLVMDESSLVKTTDKGHTVERVRFSPDDFYGDNTGANYDAKTPASEAGVSQTGGVRIGTRTDSYAEVVRQRYKGTVHPWTLDQKKEWGLERSEEDTVEQFLSVVDKAAAEAGKEMARVRDDHLRTTFDSNVPAGNKRIITATAANMTAWDESIAEDILEVLGKLKVDMERASDSGQGGYYIVSDGYIPGLLAQYFIEKGTMGTGNVNDRALQAGEVGRLLGFPEFKIDPRIPTAERTIAAGTGKFKLRIGQTHPDALVRAQSLELGRTEQLPGKPVIATWNIVHYGSHCWEPERLYEISFTLN